mmetsp:Transcript_74329/g.66875  ORF Transcript_74329/g.66875 Transcript_74329/m.66875 type:complete len:200 (+) Transcript_74329:36-635(+)
MSGVKNWLLLILIFIRIDINDGFTISILPSKEKCFHQVASEGQKVFGSYSVSYGGKLDLNIKVTDPDSDLVYEQERKPDGSYEFVALKNGRYQFCLNNQKTSVSTKRVSFSFHLGNEIKNAGLHISKHFGSLEKAVSTIEIGIYSIQDHHYYMMARDKRARYTNESTASRMSWMSFMEISAIICLVIGQLVYINHLFTK